MQKYMNNDTKMISNDAAAGLSSTGEASTEPRPKTPVGSKIRRLPDDITLTKNILINNVCRICATYYENGSWILPLYEPHYTNKRTLAELANKLLPIKVNVNDGLPEVVCRTCAGHLTMWCEMRDNCFQVHGVLIAQAKLLDGVTIPPELEAITTILRLEEALNRHRVDQSHLIETVQSVLATYLLNTSLTELVCQKCDLKTSSEEFYQHLSSKHEGVRDREAVEAFVRDHVTFEEALDSDGDCTSSVVSSSTEASEASARLDCPLCSAACSTPTRLFQHLTKHDVNLDSIPCCGLSRNKSELLRHLKKEHTADSLRCKSFLVAANTAELATHAACCDTASKSDVGIRPAVSRDETNQKRIPAVCPDCNRTFSNIYNMLKHMKKHSEASVRFDCECGKSYTTRGNLVAHRRVAHLKELRYACTECEEKFPSRSARDVHSRLHSGARPFSCSVCSRSFHAKNSLNKHRETHGPRQFECELCGKRFRRKAHLRYHVGTHPRRAT